MKNPLPGDQGLAFQTHALQMILLGPYYVRTRHCYGPPRIVSLQLVLNLGKKFNMTNYVYVADSGRGKDYFKPS